MEMDGVTGGVDGASEGDRGRGRSLPARAKRRVSLTRPAVVGAIERCFGNIAVMSAVLGVSRYGLYKYIHRHQDIVELLAAERERVKDIVEASLVKAARRGEPWAVCFFLKTQAKDRGYIERSEFVATATTISADIRARIAEVDGGGLGQSGQAGGAGIAVVADAAAPSVHQ